MNAYVLTGTYIRNNSIATLVHKLAGAPVRKTASSNLNEAAGVYSKVSTLPTSPIYIYIPTVNLCSFGVPGFLPVLMKPSNLPTLFKQNCFSHRIAHNESE